MISIKNSVVKIIRVDNVKINIYTKLKQDSNIEVLLE